MNRITVFAFGALCYLGCAKKSFGRDDSAPRSPLGRAVAISASRAVQRTLPG
jgi:hypothetical protein